MSDGSASAYGRETPVPKVRPSLSPKLVFHPRFAVGVGRYILQQGCTLQSIIADYEELMGDLVCSQSILRDAGQHLETSIYRDLLNGENGGAVADRLHRTAHLAETIDAANDLVLVHINKRLKTALDELLDYSARLSLPPGSADTGSCLTEGIVKASELVLTQLDGMLEHVTLKGGRTPLSCQAVGVQDLINRIERRSTPSANDRGVQLKTTVSSLVEKCWTDEHWVEMIMGNIVENAISVSPQGSQVTIEVGLRGTHNIEISISTLKYRTSMEAAQSALMFFGAHDHLYIERQKGGRLAGVLEKFLLQALGASASVTSSPSGGVGIALRLEAYQNGY